MFSPNLTAKSRTYTLRAQRMSSSVRGDATQLVSEPRLLTISHETAKNGKVASVMMIDDTAVVSNGTTVSSDTIRILFKIQYNPLSGRTDIETVINSAIEELKELLSTENTTKLLNKES